MVDSPDPEAAYTYAARHRALCAAASARRSAARPTVIGLPEMLTSRFAPARAATEDGGIGTHMSSHTSTCRRSDGRSSAAKIRSGPNGTVASPMVIDSPRWSSPGAK